MELNVIYTLFKFNYCIFCAFLGVYQIISKKNFELEGKEVFVFVTSPWVVQGLYDEEEEGLENAFRIA